MAGRIAVGERDFIKTTAMAGMVATLPEVLAQNPQSVAVKALNKGNNRKLLMLSDYPNSYDRLIQSVKSIKEYEFSVVPIKTDYSKAQEIAKTIQTEAPDILFFGRGGATPEVVFPIGLEVTIGGFTKNLKNFVA